MAKKNKIEEKKEEKLYTLTVNAHQLALISDACDNAGRIFRGIPETSNIRTCSELLVIMFFHCREVNFRAIQTRRIYPLINPNISSQ